MHILLITPENPRIRRFRSGQVNNFAQLTMPYLAGFVRAPDTVALWDERQGPVPFDTSADLIGITCSTPNAPHAFAMAREFRRRGRTVVLGGPHVTLLPDEARPEADVIVIGEAESSWPDLLEDVRAGRLKREYRDALPHPLSGLPTPRLDLLPTWGTLANATISSRGCTHACAFCNLRQLYAPGSRYRPVEEVIRDIRTMSGRFFVFWDDHFFMDRDHALTLMKAMEPLGKRWAAMVTLESAEDEHLLAAAARSGCVYLFIGLESFSQESLVGSGKAFNPVERYPEAIARIHRHGIAVQAGIVFGFDGDGPDIFATTLRRMEAAAVDGATVSILTPFPGTPIFEQFERQGRLITDDWSRYDGKTAVAFQPARMSSEDLWNGYQWFRRRFYSGNSILRRLRRSQARSFASLAVNLGYRWALDGQRVSPRVAQKDPQHRA